MPIKVNSPYEQHNIHVNKPWYISLDIVSIRLEDYISKQLLF